MRFLQLISIAPKTPQWCSFLSFILSIGGTIDWQNTSVNRRQLIFDELAFAVVFRVALVALTLSHEYSHALAAACLGYHTSLTETANWRGNVSVRAWTLSLCPFYTWPKEASNPCFLVPSMASSAHATIVRLFGAFFSFFVSIVFMELSSQNDLSDAWTTGAGIVAAGAFVSDVLQLEGSSDNVFGCGNFGMMVINTAEKAGVDIAKTLRRMAGATAARGRVCTSLSFRAEQARGLGQELSPSFLVRIVRANDPGMGEANPVLLLFSLQGAQRRREKQPGGLCLFRRCDPIFRGQYTCMRRDVRI
eukprot:2663514-Rhodomonas_salina.1